MIQNGTKSDHLDLLGGPGGEMVQNGTKSGHLDRLGGPGGEMIQNGTKSDRLFWAFQAALTNPPESFWPSRQL